MQASFEVALFGEFPHSLLKATLNRCTLRAESSKTLNWRDVTYDPLPPPNAAAIDWDARDAVKLLCRRDMDVKEKGDGWTFYAHGKPEPSRIEATVRQATYSHVKAGNALAFASALGYQRKEEAFKKGYEFTHGRLTIHIYRVDWIDPSTGVLFRAAPDAPWKIEVKTPPRRNTPETPITEYVDVVLEYRSYMKGLIDLDPLALTVKERIM